MLLVPRQELCIECVNLRIVKLEGYRLLTVFSRELGLLKLSGSKLGGRSEPFVRNLYTITVGKDDIHRIKQSEFLEDFSALKRNFTNLTYGWLMAETLEACSHAQETESPHIFAMLCECLAVLNTGGQEPLSVTLAYLWKLIDLLGYQPMSCLGLHEVCLWKSGQELFFDTETSAIFCKTCQAQAGYKGGGVALLPKVAEAFRALQEGALQPDENPSRQRFIFNLLLRYLQKFARHKIKTAQILLNN